MRPLGNLYSREYHESSHQPFIDGETCVFSAEPSFHRSGETCKGHTLCIRRKTLGCRVAVNTINLPNPSRASTWWQCEPDCGVDMQSLGNGVLRLASTLQPSRISHGLFPCGYIAGDYASGADDGVVADRHPWEDNCSTTNPDVFTNPDRPT